MNGTPPTPTRRPACRGAGLLAAGALLIQTPGCQNPPPPAEIEGRINVLPERPALRDEPGVPAPRHAARCAVRTVTLPLDRPLEAAWAELDETILPPLSRAVWNANGLRVGLLDASDAGGFGDALGTPDDVGRQNLVVIDRPTVLRESPPLRADFVADLTRPPAAPRLETFTRGRARLLISARPAGGGATLRLTPQHFVPRTTLTARHPLEKLLDGRVFDELAIEINLSPGTALVVGYSLPVALRPPAPDESVEPNTPTTGPNDPDAPPPDLNLDPVDLPLDLGRALMTAGKSRREQQRLIVLTVLDTR